MGFGNLGANPYLGRSLRWPGCSRAGTNESFRVRLLHGRHGRIGGQPSIQCCRSDARGRSVARAEQRPSGYPAIPQRSCSLASRPKYLQTRPCITFTCRSAPTTRALRQSRDVRCEGEGDVRARARVGPLNERRSGPASLGSRRHRDQQTTRNGVQRVDLIVGGPAGVAIADTRTPSLTRPPDTCTPR